MPRASGWLADFDIGGGSVRVRKTGATERMDAGLLREVAIWLVYHLCIRVRSWCVVPVGRSITLGFTPDVPRPWYLIRAACIWAGIRVTNDLATANCVFAFEDATWDTAPRPLLNSPAFNFACADISKSHVAQVFAAVFGYPLALDPTVHCGPAVEKSEINARHDGRVVECPCQPRAGFVYQKLIDTSDGRHVHDLRTPCIDGRPVVVWEKLRPATDRFSPRNRSAVARSSDAVFSAEEQDLIRRFCQTLGLDWGGLDILRDRRDGRIYIVDVNKTDAGPVIALSLAEKLRSTALLATALHSMLAKRIGAAEPRGSASAID